MKSITRIILEEIQKFGNAVLSEDGDVVADIINAEYNKDNVVLEAKNLTEDDYRGSHRAPGPDSDDSPMYDLTNTYGKDIYGPQALRHFGNYRPYDAYTIALIQQAKNKPNYQVKIYRAIPKVISNQEKIDDYTKRMKYILKTGKVPNDVDNFKNSSEYYDWLSDEIEKLKGQVIDNQDKVKINSGDWVTINPAYAKEHGQSNVGNFRILSKTVSAKNLYNEGDINEWGYVVESQGLTENNSSNQKKLYYHGRNIGNRPYNGNYIFITDNLGYASGYSNGKELYTYTMPFGEQKLFSIRNPEHRLLLSKYVDTESILHMRSDSGPDQELDWAAISYINSDEFDQPEDLLEHLGFYGIRLKERTGIESIYIFDQNKLKFEGEIDITTPEMIKKIGKFYRDFSKGKNFLESIIKEEISDFNKTQFYEVPDELFQKLKLRKFSDEANRSHMKIFKAKDGNEFLLKKIINEDIFYAYDLKTFKLPVATVVFDVHNDYFTGYEHNQSIKVEPKYRRIGLATALTDFAENIYDKPYKPTNLLSGEMQGFVKNRFENNEGIADTYAEKQFNMPNDVKAQDILAKGNLQKDLEKPYGYINNIAVYKNPQSLENFDADVRAIGCVSGNLYVAQKNGMFMHGQMGEYIGLDSSGAIYSGKYLLLNRDGNTNNFILSDTAEEDYPKYYEHFNNMIKNIETKNSNYKILASIDTVDSQ